MAWARLSSASHCSLWPWGERDRRCRVHDQSDLAANPGAPGHRRCRRAAVLGGRETSRRPRVAPEPPGVQELKLVGVIAMGTGLAEAGMVFLPALAVAGLGVEESTASFMLLPLVAAMIVGAPLAGTLLASRGAKQIIQCGLLLVVSGMLVFGLPELSTATFYVAGALVGVGLSGLLGAPLRYVVIREAPEHQRGAGRVC